MSYFVLYDTQIKAAVANCGTSEINSYFNYNRRGAIVGSITLPGSVKIGVGSHDYIAKIAPSPDFKLKGSVVTK